MTTPAQRCKVCKATLSFPDSLAIGYCWSCRQQQTNPQDAMTGYMRSDVFLDRRAKADPSRGEADGLNAQQLSALGA